MVLFKLREEVEWLIGKPSLETQGLMCCFRISLENKMSLQILISMFELVPMSQKTVALMGRDKVLVNKMIWSGTAAVLMSAESCPLSNYRRMLNILKMKAQLVTTYM